MTLSMPRPSAMKRVAACAGAYCAWLIFSLTTMLFIVSGCAITDKPARATLYDFGPGALATQAVQAPSARPPGADLRPLAISDIATPGGALENQAVLYRLGYTAAQELRP